MKLRNCIDLIVSTCTHVLMFPPRLHFHFGFVSLLAMPPGYVYVLFDNEKSVKALLQSCTHDYMGSGEWYFKISSRRMRCKEVGMGKGRCEEEEEEAEKVR